MEASERQGDKLLAAWETWKESLAVVATGGGGPFEADGGSSLVAASKVVWSLLGSAGPSSALEIWHAVERCADMRSVL